MAVDNLKGKLAKIVSKEPSKWLEEAKWRRENRAWLKRSQAIALKVLIRLDELDLTQKKLAEKMGVSAQLVNKWLKGKENLTLETISRLEYHLGIHLIQLVKDTVIEEIEYQETTFEYKELKNIHSETKIIPLEPIFSIEGNEYNTAI